VSNTSVTLTSDNVPVIASSIVSSSSNYYSPQLLGNQIVLPYIDNSNALKASIFSLANLASVTTLTLDSGASIPAMDYSSGLLSSSYLPIDTNNAWFTYGINGGINKAVKLTYNGSVSVATTQTSLPGTKIIKSNENYYFFINGNKYLVTDTNSLAINSIAKSFDCNGFRYLPNRCLTLDTSSSATRINFLVGY
jgi:hypothetical protein